MLPFETAPVYQMFLSYNSKDRDKIQQVRTALEQRGVKVFYDCDALRAGDIWVRRLSDAIENSQSIGVFLGSEIGRYQRLEIRAAWPKATQPRGQGPEGSPGPFKLIPILLECKDCPPSLRRFSYIDLRQDSTWSMQVDRLADVLLVQDSSKSYVTPDHESMFNAVTITLFGPDDLVVRDPSAFLSNMHVRKPQDVPASSVSRRTKEWARHWKELHGICDKCAHLYWVFYAELLDFRRSVRSYDHMSEKTERIAHLAAHADFVIQQTYEHIGELSATFMDDKALISATDIVWEIPVYCDVVQHLLHFRLLGDEIRFEQACRLTRRLCDLWQALLHKADETLKKYFGDSVT